MSKLILKAAFLFTGYSNATPIGYSIAKMSSAISEPAGVAGEHETKVIYNKLESYLPAPTSALTPALTASGGQLSSTRNNDEVLILHATDWARTVCLVLIVLVLMFVILSFVTRYLMGVLCGMRPSNEMSASIGSPHPTSTSDYQDPCKLAAEAPALADKPISCTDDAELRKDVEMARFRRGYPVIAILLTGNGLIGCNTTMLQSFLPVDALAHSVDSSLVGFLFSAYPIGVIAGLVLADLLLRDADPLRTLGVAYYVQALLSALTGLASAWPAYLSGGYVAHVALSRFLVGILAGVSFPTTQRVTWNLAPVSAIPMLVSWTVAGRQVGMSTGPVLGGILYSAGGLALPFAFSACAHLLLACALPYAALCCFGKEEDMRKTERQIISVWKLYAYPGYLMVLGVTLVITLTDGSLQPILELFIMGIAARQGFELTTMGVGLIFSASLFFFMAQVFFSGALAGKVLDLTTLQAIGIGIWLASLPLLAPSGVLLPFLHESLPGTCVALAMYNVGKGLLQPMQPLLSLRVLQTDGGFQPKQLAGAVNSAQLSFGMFGSAVGTSVGTLLRSAFPEGRLGYAYTFDIIALFILASAVPLLIGLRRYHRMPSGGPVWQRVSLCCHDKKGST